MKQITKSYLEFLGITHVSSDGTIFTKRGQLTPRDNGRGYMRVEFSGVREDTKPHDILIHYIVYAWFKGEVPYGHQIHHKDRNKANNSIDNLVAMTPEEHKKEHESTREIKCKLTVPRKWYVEQIEKAEALNTRYGASKACVLKAKLRYYDAHIEEAIQKHNDFRDLEILKYLKNKVKEQGDLEGWHRYCRLIKNWETLEPDLKEKIMNSIAKFL